MGLLNFRIFLNAEMDIDQYSRGDWGEMKQGQVERVTITFMGDNA